MEHSRLLKFIIQKDTRVKMDANNSKVEAEVPGQQNMRGDSNDNSPSISGRETVHSTEVFMESVEDLSVVKNQVFIDGNHDQQNNQTDKQSKIPISRLRQTVEKVKLQRRKMKKERKNSENNSQRRTSIPKINKQTTSVDDFDKLYQEVVKTDVTEATDDVILKTEVTDEIDIKFEEIVHDYDNKIDALDADKIKKTKIPKRVQDGDIERRNKIIAARDNIRMRNSISKELLNDYDSYSEENKVEIRNTKIDIENDKTQEAKDFGSKSNDVRVENSIKIGKNKATLDVNKKHDTINAKDFEPKSNVNRDENSIKIGNNNTIQEVTKMSEKASKFEPKSNDNTVQNNIKVDVTNINDIAKISKDFEPNPNVNKVDNDLTKAKTTKDSKKKRKSKAKRNKSIGKVHENASSNEVKSTELVKNDENKSSLLQGDNINKFKDTSNDTNVIENDIVTERETTDAKGDIEKGLLIGENIIKNDTAADEIKAVNANAIVKDFKELSIDENSIQSDTATKTEIVHSKVTINDGKLDSNETNIIDNDVAFEIETTNAKAIVRGVEKKLSIHENIVKKGTSTETVTKTEIIENFTKETLHESTNFDKVEIIDRFDRRHDFKEKVNLENFVQNHEIFDKEFKSEEINNITKTDYVNKKVIQENTEIDKLKFHMNTTEIKRNEIFERTLQENNLVQVKTRRTERDGAMQFHNNVLRTQKSERDNAIQAKIKEKTQITERDNAMLERDNAILAKNIEKTQITERDSAIKERNNTIQAKNIEKTLSTERDNAMLERDNAIQNTEQKKETNIFLRHTKIGTKFLNKEQSESNMTETANKTNALEEDKAYNKVDLKTENLEKNYSSESYQKEQSNELPEKNSILSKIALFEQKHSELPSKIKLPKKLPKITTNITNEVKTHIHTPLIVDEHFKVQSNINFTASENITNYEGNKVQNINVKKPDIHKQDSIKQEISNENTSNKNILKDEGNKVETINEKKQDLKEDDYIKQGHNNEIAVRENIPYVEGNKVENIYTKRPDIPKQDSITLEVSNENTSNKNIPYDQRFEVQINNDINLKKDEAILQKGELESKEIVPNDPVNKDQNQIEAPVIIPKFRPVKELLNDFEPKVLPNKNETKTPKVLEIPKFKTFDEILSNFQPKQDVIKREFSLHNTSFIEYETNKYNKTKIENSNSEILKASENELNLLTNKTQIDNDNVFNPKTELENSENKNKYGRTKSLTDGGKGNVQKILNRLKSFDKIEFEKKATEIPKKLSVMEKIALFERKITPIKAQTTNAPIKTTENIKNYPADIDLQDKINELLNAKKYGKIDVPRIELANGQQMPVIALGTALLEPNLTKYIVAAAIDLGYRAIDTAYIYGNEKAVGEGIKTKIDDGTVKREDLFIISKLWSTFHRTDLVEQACRDSLKTMGLEYFDLYLIHNPMSFKEGGSPIPKIANVIQYSTYDFIDAWYGMEQVLNKSLVKGIGLSNFNSSQIQRVLERGSVKPVVNQVECHPYLTQEKIHKFCLERNITLSCYGVLGSKGTPVFIRGTNPAAIDDPLIQVMASGLGVSTAQLLIKYQLDSGRSVVVKCSSPSHLWDNLQCLKLNLTSVQTDALNALNKNKRTFTFVGMGDTHKNYPF